MVSLDSISRSPTVSACAGSQPRMDGLRPQQSTEGPTSTVSSWLISSLDLSNSTIKYLSGWGIHVGEDPPSAQTGNSDDDTVSWRNVSTIPSTPSRTKTTLGQNSQSNVNLPTTCTIRNIVDRKEIYKNVQSSHQAAKERLTEAVADTRKSKRNSQLLQHRVPVPSPPTAASTCTGRVESNMMLKTQRKVNQTTGTNPLPSAFQTKKLHAGTTCNANVRFNLSLNEIVVVPRVDPADKPLLFFRPKEFRVFNRDELNLFHAYHFYQEMYNDEINFDSKEALRRRMSSIANLMFAAPGGKNASKKRKRTPVKKKRKKPSSS